MTPNKTVTKAELKDTLDKAFTWTSKPLYAVYYQGKPLRVSKKRVYLQAHRAKTELTSYVQKYGEDRKSIKKAIDELIAEGLLEIREI